MGVVSHPEPPSLYESPVSAGDPVRAVRLALRLRAVPEEVSRARRESRTLARRAGLSPSRCADVALAVGEICANTVVHAYRGGPPGTFLLTVAADPELVEVTVADEGRGLAPREDSPGAGYGLPLAAAIATTLELGTPSTGGTVVRMTFAP